MRNDRDKVLGNLRRRPAVFPDGVLPEGWAGWKGADGAGGVGGVGGAFSRHFFPDPAGGEEGWEGRSGWISRFIRMAESNAATVARVGGMDEVPAAAAAWLRGRGAELRMVCGPGLADLDWASAGISAECRRPADGDEVGATRVLAAAADTGALLQVSDGGHSLTLSLLPPLHLAVLRAEDILADMESVWARMFVLHPEVPPRAACLITGPSRTADIEQTLVLGAHGPLAVHAVVVGG